MSRIFFASLFGGIAMFAWTRLNYTVLPLGYIGVRGIPNEISVLHVLQKNIAEKSGVYVFPGPFLAPNQTAEQQAKAMQDLEKSVARHPSGILFYSAAGTRPIEMFHLLAMDFVIDLTQVFLAVLLLSQTRLTTVRARVGFVLATGILVAWGANLPFWNWYGAGGYFLASMLIQIVGFLCAGLVAALVLRKQTFGVKAPVPFLQKLFWGDRECERQQSSSQLRRWRGQ